ncbi:TVP38/TMEM64 family protein [Alkalihalobacillus pseudalcaliphilus]|uniref:TVP38/TMEM64 family protein n=1 Tax=Alkalihalobacillus pseudalcaliphilus TaxID=79884 RepID=UPI00064E0C5C|nr:VTT domain-containing protein [Alkalihalobacillus pseudalcaliphilus]KMK74581.1 hypothetical protein AB990_18930 [Alkalihalobacillus pseudalcaliphilus]
MNEKLEAARQLIEASGWLAPLLYLLLHLVRPFLFIPVLLTCLAGGYIFGTIYGSIYSIIGLTLTSVSFYVLIHYFPSFGRQLSQLKRKVIKSNHGMSTPQLMVIRLMPFVHFHFVSLYLLETTKNFREYTIRSIWFGIPPAIIYTAFGDIIHALPLTGTIVLMSLLIVCIMILPKKEEVITWREFFRPSSS